MTKHTSPTSPPRSITPANLFAADDENPPGVSRAFRFGEICAITLADERAATLELQPENLERAARLMAEPPTESAAKVIAERDEAEAAKDEWWDNAPELLRRFPILSTTELQREFPEPPKPVIEGIVGEGEKLILGGASKAGKTYCLLNLAGAVAHGEKWLGHRCRKGSVLFLNFEVSPPRMAERDRHLRAAGVSMEGVDFLNLRGSQFAWPELVEALEFAATRRRYSLVVLDPIYKLLGATPENDNSAVAAMLAEVERIATDTGAAVAFAHHFSKGNKSETASIDRLSGAGAFARDPDAILTLTDHEEPHCFTLEATVRNYAAPAPVVVEYTFPRYAVREELDSSRLKSTRGGGHNKKGGAETVVETLKLAGGKLTGGELAKALAEATGSTDRSARNWINAAERAGRIVDRHGLWTVAENKENPNPGKQSQ